MAIMTSDDSRFRKSIMLYMKCSPPPQLFFPLCCLTVPTYFNVSVLPKGTPHSGIMKREREREIYLIFLLRPYCHSVIFMLLIRVRVRKWGGTHNIFPWVQRFPPMKHVFLKEQNWGRVFQAATGRGRHESHAPQAKLPMDVEMSC